MEKFIAIANRFPRVSVRYIKLGKIIESREMNSRDLLPTIIFTSYKELDGQDEHEWRGKITIFNNTEMYFRLHLTEDDNRHIQHFIMNVSSDYNK